MNIKINNIINIEGINKLSSVSAITFEGIAPTDNNVNNIAEWFKGYEAVKDEGDLEFHVISGKLMNEAFELTSTNKYPNDLSILSITGVDNSKIITKRFEVGGRWMDG